MTKVSLQIKMAEYGKWLGRIGSDSRIMSTHVSLFSALFVCWQHGGFNSPFAVTRRKLMAHSRIASIATYHKCIRELDTFGYIRYKPTYHPKLGSQVYWPPE